jgi:hypothetical protein
MVNELEDLLPDYAPSNRVRCFTHVLNLIAKSLLKQFDVVKKSKNDDGLNEEDHELLTLAENLEEEELTTADELIDNGEESNEDGMEDWVDEVGTLTAAERELLEESIRPVKMVLVKVGYKMFYSPDTEPVLQVRKLAYKIVHSSTILLPAWKACLQKLKLPERIMSRDVTTRWNSTYDMLHFLVTYRNAVEQFTSDRQNDLRQYELNKAEWVIVTELCSVLKVCQCHNTVQR